MPTNIRRRSPGSGDPQERAIGEKLLTGHWWPILVSGGGSPLEPTEERLREIWERNRSDIFAKYPDCWAARYFDALAEDRRVTAWEKWTKTELDQQAVSEGYYFDEHAADRAVKFIERFLFHSKGRWQGQNFRLSNWQKFKLVMPLYGWKRPDGSRRFRICFVFIPKKNGKSTLTSGLSLYHLIGDNEAGAEVYCGAIDSKQAMVVFKESQNMVYSSPILSRRLVVQESKRFIHDLKTRSFFHALSSDTDQKEGLNISFSAIDELHVHKNRDLLDVLRYGGEARTQPLLLIITTAGDTRIGPCWDELKYARKVRDGKINDLEYLPIIYEADEILDRKDPKYWTYPETWFKTNPSLGDTLSEFDMKQRCMRASQNPMELAKFKRYRLNLWGYGEAKWIPMNDWDECAGDGSILPLDFAPQKKPLQIPPALLGRKCSAGLDLSSVNDTTSLVLDFPCILDDDRILHVWLIYVWGPEGAVERRERTDQAYYRRWAEEGFMELTPGKRVNYDRIRRCINDLGELVEIEQIAVDRWNSSQLQDQLEDDGFIIVEFGQGFASMSAPSKLFECLWSDRLLIHGGHPVLNWQASNVVAKMDSAENIKPDKEKSKEKIDIVVAGIMALDCSSRRPPEKEAVLTGRVDFI